MPHFFCTQACLGAAAKEGERNVVQVTTENDEGDEVTHTILSMRVGLNEQVSSTETDDVLERNWLIDKHLTVGTVVIVYMYWCPYLYVHEGKK